MNELFLNRSWLEINLDQIQNNYDTYRSKLPSNSTVMAVVKADAYGHGAKEVSMFLQNSGVSFFAVSNLIEAIELRNVGIEGEILILGYTSPNFSDLIIKHNLTQTLVSEEHAKEFAYASHMNMKCQFAIDTGMNRIGLDADNLDECERLLRDYSKRFYVNGIFTHLCVADSNAPENLEFTKVQIEKFENLVDRIADMNLQYVHCMNSAGGYYFNSKSKFRNIARLGIMLYGLKPNFCCALPLGMKMAMTWKTSVIMVKTVSAGESVGYGRSYIADKDIKVATLSTGYADGYPRALSNKGYVIIKGKRAPIIGRICMDQMMVDVSAIDGIIAGDEAILIGSDGYECITADDLASTIGTIGYEIVCGISKRVQKCYVVSK